MKYRICAVPDTVRFWDARRATEPAAGLTASAARLASGTPTTEVTADAARRVRHPGINGDVLRGDGDVHGDGHHGYDARVASATAADEASTRA